MPDSYEGELTLANGRLWVGGADRGLLHIVEEWATEKVKRWVEIRMTKGTLTITDHDGCNVRGDDGDFNNRIKNWIPRG